MKNRYVKLLCTLIGIALLLSACSQPEAPAQTAVSSQAAPTPAALEQTPEAATGPATTTLPTQTETPEPELQEPGYEETADPGNYAQPETPVIKIADTCEITLMQTTIAQLDAYGLFAMFFPEPPESVVPWQQTEDQALLYRNEAYCGALNVTNTGDADSAVSECVVSAYTVTFIRAEDEDQVLPGIAFPGNITAESTEADIRAVYGEPMQSENWLIYEKGPVLYHFSFAGERLETAEVIVNFI